MSWGSINGHRVGSTQVSDRTCPHSPSSTGTTLPTIVHLHIPVAFSPSACHARPAPTPQSELLSEGTDPRSALVSFCPSRVWCTVLKGQVMCLTSAACQIRVCGVPTTRRCLGRVHAFPETGYGHPYVVQIQQSCVDGVALQPPYEEAAGSPPNVNLIHDLTKAGICSSIHSRAPRGPDFQRPDRPSHLQECLALTPGHRRYAPIRRIPGGLP